MKKGNNNMIYLASPFFTEKEQKVYKKVVDYLRSTCGEKIFVPQEHEIENAWKLPNEEWGNLVFGMDLQALMKCDEVVVLNWGMYSDSGTAWECGAAYALGKKITMVLCNPNSSVYSLMMVNGCHSVIKLDDFLENRFCESKTVMDSISQK